jgi:molybdopterin-guanine dinucleotide biosynthesis protein A
VAALAAALPLVDSDLIAVLGADLPFLTAAELQELCELADGQDAAMLVDDRGRPQYLAAVWQATSLRSAVAAVGEPVGQPLSGVYAGRSVARLATPGSAAPPAWWDCDTVGDLETARNWL